jgi:hypothetical protein
VSLVVPFVTFVVKYNLKHYLLLIILLSLATLCLAEDYSLIGYDSNKGVYSQYLGKLYIKRGSLDTDSYKRDSIFNSHSQYGNEYNTNSIWNRYGTYGSEFSNYSPRNQHASQPPVLQNSYGESVGYLTVNSFYARNTRLGKSISEQFKEYLKRK